MPPDVRRGFASPQDGERRVGSCPSSGLWPKKTRAKPEPRAQPNFITQRNGEAKPRLTSGGIAEASTFEAKPPGTVLGIFGFPLAFSFVWWTHPLPRGGTDLSRWLACKLDRSLQSINRWPGKRSVPPRG